MSHIEEPSSADGKAVPLSSRQELGPYTLVDQIAVGGMAEIYLAKTRGLAGFEKYCALKVIHPDFANDDGFIQMLIDEAKISVGLNHANIVQILELGRYKDTYYIAMEYIDGADLFRVMRNLSIKGVIVPIDVAVYLTQEVATGLDYAHRRCDADGTPRQIIHRDISPQNILVSYAGEVKIVDFGIAKAASRSRNTQIGVIKGKYFYMSPEQAWGRPVDPRTDIFSAGIVLYEVLTGKMLYREEDTQKLLMMARQADIPPVSTCRPDVPKPLEQIVMKALARRPEDRWPSAAALQSALTNFLFSYAPDFTPERVARLVRVAIDDEPSGSFPRRDVASDDSRARAWRSPVEVQPLFPSLPADFDDLTPLDMSGQHTLSGADDVDQTMVSGPPRMSQVNNERRRFADSDDDWADESEDLSRTARLPRRAEASHITAPPEVIIHAQSGVSARRHPLTMDESDSVVARLEPTMVGHPDRPEGLGALGGEAALVKDHESSVGVDVRAGAAQRRRSVSQSRDDQFEPSAASTAETRPIESVVSPRSISPSPASPSQVLATTPPIRRPAAQVQSATQHAGLARRVDPAIDAADLSWRRLAVSAAPSAKPGFPPFPPPARGANREAAPAASARRRRPMWRIVLLAFAITTVLAGLGVGIGLHLLPRIRQVATLEVISVPEGASVTLNGKKLNGRTRMLIPVSDPTQPQRVTVSLPDYENSTTVLQFDGQQRKQVIAALVPKFGQLQLDTDPPGAHVTVDGILRGKTPIKLTRLSLRRSLQLLFEKAGYRSVERRIQWDQQTWQRVKVVLRRADPSGLQRSDALD